MGNYQWPLTFEALLDDQVRSDPYTSSYDVDDQNSGCTDRTKLWFYVAYILLYCEKINQYSARTENLEYTATSSRWQNKVKERTLSHGEHSRSHIVFFYLLCFIRALPTI